jgi:hypothetical protein
MRNMLDTQFFFFSHSTGVSSKFVRAERYSIPLALNEHVASIFYTIQMPSRLSNRRHVVPIKDDFIFHCKESENRNLKVISSGYVTPALLKKAYSIDSTSLSVNATQGVFEAVGTEFSQTNLSYFLGNFSLPYQKVTTIIGGHNVSSADCSTNINNCAEGNLDVQYMTAISPSPTTYWYTDFLTFSDWLVTMANIKKPPLVVSVSYGIDEIFVSASEMDAFNIQAIK